MALHLRGNERNVLPLEGPEAGCRQVSENGLVVTGATTLESLALLESLGIIDGLSLTLPEDIPYERYEELGMALAQHHRKIAWLIGDWIVYGEARWEREQIYAQAQAWTQLAEGTINNYASTARRVQPPQRHPTLPFSIHMDVAKLPPLQQREWLEKTEINDWSREDLRANLTAIGLREERPRLTPALVIPDVEESARDLVRSAKPVGVDFVVRRASFVQLCAALGEEI